MALITSYNDTERPVLMAASERHPLAQLLIEHRNSQFWLLQFIGWSGLSIVSYFSLNLWYDQPELSYVGHNILQSVVGALITWPMRYLLKSCWEMGWVKRLFLVSVVVFAFATLWSVLRLSLFLLLTDETNLWGDFGGWLFPSIFIFLCWTTLYHGIKYYQLAQHEHAVLMKMAADRNEQSMRLAQAEAAARVAQLTMLRYQLNPHFLFNTLNALQGLIASKRNDRAGNMISELGHFLRYSLQSDPVQTVDLEQEIEALKMYLNIEQARFGERLEVKVDYDPAIGSAQIPSMLLQPLVENAIKYAIGPSEEGGCIEINAMIENNSLVLTVSDNGPGLDDTDELPAPSGTGVGLRNIRERLANSYGDGAAMYITNRVTGGLMVVIRLPYVASYLRAKAS